MKLSIRYSATVLVAIGLAAVALAACGGSDAGDDGNATAADTSGGIVSVKSVDGTDVLVDSDGRTLYTADVEKGGRILCTGMCTSFWDPIGASAREAKTAASGLELDLGVVKRPGGAEQLTFDGVPLYSFTDEEPGRLDGDGFVDDFQGTHFEWAAATTGAATGPSSAGGSDSSSPY